MPSSPDPLLRTELQAPGEDTNTWGGPNGLNRVITLLAQAIAGRVALAVSGPVTLTSLNYVADQSRQAFLDCTGTGGTITIPSVSKLYLVANGTTGDVIVSSGSGTATIGTLDIAWVVCDGTNVRRAVSTDFGGARLKNVGAPTSDSDASTKKYVDDTAFSAAGGTLPGQTGQAGHALFTDGTLAGWRQILTADVSGLQAQLNTIKAQTIAFALVFGGGAQG